MSPRSTAVLRAAARLVERDAERFGEEFGERRMRLRASLAAVGRVVGVAPSVIWRIEHGDPAVDPAIRAAAARVVGGTSRLAFYGDATPLIHDAAHARIVERLVSTAGPGWRVTVEAPVPGFGQRSVDVRLDGRVDIVLMEIESHVRRWEEILRELAGKRAAFEAAGQGRAIHVVLVLPPTRHHRALITTVPATIGAALPVAPSELRRALADGGRWPGDGILWIAGGPERA